MWLAPAMPSANIKAALIIIKLQLARSICDRRDRDNTGHTHCVVLAHARSYLWCVSTALSRYLRAQVYTIYIVFIVPGCMNCDYIVQWPLNGRTSINLLPTAVLATQLSSSIQVMKLCNILWSKGSPL